MTCPECETTARVETSEARTVIERHNEQRHDGEPVAGYDPAFIEQAKEVVDE